VRAPEVVRFFYSLTRFFRRVMVLSAFDLVATTDAILGLVNHAIRLVARVVVVASLEPLKALRKTLVDMLAPVFAVEAIAVRIALVALCGAGGWRIRRRG